MVLTLDSLREGQTGAIRAILGGHRIRQRLNQIGLHPGDEIQVVRTGAFGGPILIQAHGVNIAIGRGMARKIEVEVEPA
jgi:ferrous iron transport protein A